MTLFLSLTFGMSAVIWVLMAFSEIVRGLSEVLLMWTPGVAAFIACWVRRENVRNLGWTWRPLRYQAVSFLLPVGISIAVYALVWISGLGGFDRAQFDENGARMVRGLRTLRKLGHRSMLRQSWSSDSPS